MTDISPSPVTRILYAGTGILAVILGFNWGSALVTARLTTNVSGKIEFKAPPPPTAEAITTKDWASIMAGFNTARGRAAFLQQLATMEVEEVLELLGSATPVRHGLQQSRLKETLFQRLAELDPAAAITAFESLPGNERRNHASRRAAIRGIALGVSQSETLAIQLIEASSHVSDVWDKNSMVDEVFSNLNSRTLEATLQMARIIFEATKDETESDSSLEFIIDQITDNWFLRDSKTSWELALKNRIPTDDDDFEINEILCRLAEWNATSALQLAGRENIPIREEDEFLERWLEQQPDAASTWLDEQVDAFSDAAFVAEWIESGYPMTLLLKKMDERLLANDSVSGALSVWASRSPDSFGNWLDLKSDSETRHLLRSTIENAEAGRAYSPLYISSVSPNTLFYYLTRFSSTLDPALISTAVDGIDETVFTAEIAQLQERAANMPAGLARTALEDGLAIKQLRENPDQLFDLIDRGVLLNDNESRLSAIRNVVEGITRHSIDDIWNYADRIPDNLHSDFYLEVFRIQVNHSESKLEVANLLSTIAANSSEKVAENIGSQVAKQFVNNGRWNLAADWATSTASEVAAQTAMEFSIKLWAEQSPTAAAEWIAAKDIPSKLRDTAVADLVPHLADDPNAALQWAATIDDRDKRISAAEGVARIWRELDLRRAQEALAHSGLSVAEAAKVAEAAGLILANNKEDQSK